MRPQNLIPNCKPTAFQSTHPLRGATSYRCTTIICNDLFQSTHPLRGATIAPPCGGRQKGISIHAPLAGCDDRFLPFEEMVYGFQSTHPLRGATNLPDGRTISSLPFQSTHPLRGATIRKTLDGAGKAFQSTHPLRGATAKMHKIFCAFCDNRQFYRFSPSGVPSVGALFTYFRGLRRAGAGANLPVNGCALGLRAKSSASPQAGRSACSRSVRFYSRTSCRGNKTAGCRVPGP